MVKRSWPIPFFHQVRYLRSLASDGNGCKETEANVTRDLHGNACILLKLSTGTNFIGVNKTRSAIALRRDFELSFNPRILWEYRTP